MKCGISDCENEATHYQVQNGVVKVEDIAKGEDEQWGFCKDCAEKVVETNRGDIQAILIEDWKKYLETYSWKVYRLSVPNMEALPDMGRTLLPIIHALAVDGRRMYFNFYFADQVWYMKLGLLNFDEDMTEGILENARSEFGARITEEDPDIRLIDGEVIEDLKVLSCETFFQIMEQEALSLKQAELYFHFLCNMMGFTYDMELDVALNLAYGVRFRRAN